MSGKPNLLKIVLIGDCNTGKTALIKRIENNSFDANFRPTVGVDFCEKEVQVKGKRYTLQIWDTAGQEKFKSITRPFYKGADCCLLTFALDDLRSFENIATWKKDFLHFSDVQDENMFPFVILGNKVDVDKRVVNKEMVRDWCNQNGNCPYYETSAKDATNVESAFKTAVERYAELENTKRYIEMENTKRLIELETSKRYTEMENNIRKRNKERESIHMEPPRSKGSTVDLSKKPKQRRGCC